MNIDLVGSCASYGCRVRKIGATFKQPSVSPPLTNAQQRRVVVAMDHTDHDYELYEDMKTRPSGLIAMPRTHQKRRRCGLASYAALTLASTTFIQTMLSGATPTSKPQGARGARATTSRCVGPGGFA